MTNGEDSVNNTRRGRGGGGQSHRIGNRKGGTGGGDGPGVPWWVGEGGQFLGLCGAVGRSLSALVDAGVFFFSNENL